MKVAQVNKFNFVRGGADQFFLALAVLLRAQGQTVVKFCGRDERNLPDEDQQFWPAMPDFQNLNLLNWPRALMGIFYSLPAARHFASFLDATKPDLVHCHNIYHHLSPAILAVAKRRGLPVVMHLHDYNLLGPNYHLFARGQIYEAVLSGNYWRCLADRCVKNSWRASLLATVASYWQLKLWRPYQRYVDLLIAPSQFVYDKFLATGWPKEKLTILPHFIDAQNFQPNFVPGTYFIYVGRLSAEKGVAVLLAAMALVAKARLKIVGSGDETAELKKLTAKLKLTGRVEFVGQLEGKALHEVVRDSLAVVVPSVWYEIFGLVSLEAQALGKPVIASDIGGLPETLVAGASGLLFTTGDDQSLAEKMSWLLANPQEAEALGRVGRRLVEEKFNPQDYWRRLGDLSETVGGSGERAVMAGAMDLFQDGSFDPFFGLA